MFGPDLEVINNMQKTSSETDIILIDKNIKDTLSNLSGFLKNKLAEWLKDSVCEYIVHAQT